MKFYESGLHSQIMPSGHMAHALPRENFKAKALPQAKATIPNPEELAKTHAIIQALRSPNGQAHGLSAPSVAQQGVRGTGTFLSGPRSSSRTSSISATPQRPRV